MPIGWSMSGPVTSGATVSSSGESSDTGMGTGDTSTGDTGTGDTGAEGCDPLADPLVECGPQQRCDIATLTCVDAFGTGVVDDACSSDDDCAPAFICHDTRCRQPCSPTSSPECADARVCTGASAPIPGLCLEPCVLLQANCSHPDDECKRGVGAEGTLTVCVYNPGNGVEGDACSDDGDCGAGYLCTPAAQHTLGCSADAPDCCAVVCDELDLPCFGQEPVCYTLGIVDQPSVGYCGP